MSVIDEPVALPLDVSDLTIDAEARVRRTILPNGMRVLTENIPGMRSASIGFWVQVGSRDEDPVRFGSTHFLEHLLFKGTPTRSALDIASAFDAIGADNNALTGKEQTCYYARVRDRDLTTALRILVDMIVSSVLDAHEFELERGVILEELAMASDDPEDVVHERFATLVYPHAALGRPIGGTAETISAVERDQVWEHYRRWYSPSRIVCTVAGAVDHDALVGELSRLLELVGWTDSAPVVPRRSTERAPLPYRAASGVLAKHTEQENIVLGVPGIVRTDDRAYAMSVLHAVLGSGMSSRLFQQVRERRGLAYSVYSFGDAYSDGGSFGVYVGCQPGKAAEAIRVIRGELSDIASEGITEEELVRGRGQVAGASALRMEDSYARMGRLGRSEIGAGEFLTMDASLRKLEKVTCAQVQELAASLLAEPLSVSAVGPLSQEDLQLG